MTFTVGLRRGRPKQSARASQEQYVHVNTNNGRRPICYGCFQHAVGLRGDPHVDLESDLEETFRTLPWRVDVDLGWTIGLWVPYIVPIAALSLPHPEDHDA